jgi:hypothetical protein
MKRQSFRHPQAEAKDEPEFSAEIELATPDFGPLAPYAPNAKIALSHERPWAQVRRQAA